MTDKFIQINDYHPDPLVELARSLEEQADIIVKTNLKAIENNISALSGILEQLGVKTDSL
ncbi:MAG: hypothetical protein FWG07_08755 [Treponema sp.]|nr:hypothetical protein [Treponema sp.]